MKVFSEILEVHFFFFLEINKFSVCPLSIPSKFMPYHVGLRNYVPGLDNAWEEQSANCFSIILLSKSS